MACRRLRFGVIASCAGEIVRSYKRMNSALRREYLAAMGLQGWAVRGKSPPQLQVVAPPEAAPPEAVPPEAAPPETVAQRVVAQPREVATPRELGVPREAGVDWPELRARVAACTRCTLCHPPTQTVFGVGNQQAE